MTAADESLLDEDPVDPDLPEHLQAILRWRWLDLIDRMKIPSQRKAVAKALARFGDADGTNVFPGEKKVADMANLHETNTRAHIKALVGLGMLCLKQAGGGRGGATNVYRLTRPTDITALPLWLDPAFNRIPDGAAFVPLAAEHRAAALGETVEYRAPALGETVAGNPEYRAVTLGETSEHRALTLGEAPVDNPAPGETPSVLRRNTERFEPEYRALALPDHLSTRPRPKEPAWLPQVGTSLAEPITEPPPALADLVADAPPSAWVPEPEPPPRIVTGSAELTPTPEAAAAIAILTALPDEGEWFRAAAARDLRAEPAPDLSASAIAIRAAEILRRIDPETRSA